MFMGMWFVVPAAILAAILVAAVAAGSPRSASHRSEAVDILDRRLASGELTVEEHAERRGILMQAKVDATGRPTWVGLITVIVLVVVVAIAAATSVGSWRGSHGGGWMGGHMGGGSSGASAQTVTDGRTVEVEAGDLWFAPETIEVGAEQSVNITLDNTGRMFHDLTVPAADLVISAEAGDQVSGGLTMTEPGTYEFLCSVPGHAQAGMRGTIVVTEG